MVIRLTGANKYALKDGRDVLREKIVFEPESELTRHVKRR